MNQFIEMLGDSLNQQLPAIANYLTVGPNSLDLRGERGTCPVDVEILSDDLASVTVAEVVVDEYDIWNDDLKQSSLRDVRAIIMAAYYGTIELRHSTLLGHEVRAAASIYDNSELLFEIVYGIASYNPSLDTELRTFDPYVRDPRY